MELSSRMQMYRAKNRMTQKELASKCGLSLQTINSIENCKQDPSTQTRLKIELVIGKE